MLRVLVDSGSSIKADELEKYNVELIPLKIFIDGKEYFDGDLPLSDFWKKMMSTKDFPKTSLPALEDCEKKVNAYTSQGDDVIILTISSKISGTHNALRLLFQDNPKVRVIDSKVAVGGMRLIVDEINRNREKSLDEVEQIVEKLIPRIKIMAIPETLDYLFKGGRLSRLGQIVGNLLKVSPVIGFKEGMVHVDAKKMGQKSGMSYIVKALEEHGVDPNFDIVASYTYDISNLNKLIAMTDEKFRKQIRVYDNLDPCIACHWGPNAFGYIFVSKN